MPYIGQFSYGLAGALLGELVLAGRLRFDAERVLTTDPRPIGEPLHDWALASVAGSAETRTVKHWVEYLNTLSKPKFGTRQPHGYDNTMLEYVVDRLIARGVVRHEREYRVYFTTFPVDRVVDGAVRQEIVDGLRAVVLGGATPDARTFMLLSIARAYTDAEWIFPRNERRAAGKRVKEIVGDDVLWKAVHDVSQASSSSA